MSHWASSIDVLTIFDDALLDEAVLTLMLQLFNVQLLNLLRRSHFLTLEQDVPSFYVFCGVWLYDVLWVISCFLVSLHRYYCFH